MCPRDRCAKPLASTREFAIWSILAKTTHPGSPISSFTLQTMCDHQTILKNSSKTTYCRGSVNFSCVVCGPWTSELHKNHGQPESTLIFNYNLFPRIRNTLPSDCLHFLPTGFQCLRSFKHACKSNMPNTLIWIKLKHLLVRRTQWTPMNTFARKVRKEKTTQGSWWEWGLEAPLFNKFEEPVILLVWNTGRNPTYCSHVTAEDQRGYWMSGNFLAQAQLSRSLAAHAQLSWESDSHLCSLSRCSAPQRQTPGGNQFEIHTTHSSAVRNLPGWESNF